MDVFEVFQFNRFDDVLELRLTFFAFIFAVRL
jgi:hypothetical protein